MTLRVRTAVVVLVLTAMTMGGAFAAVWARFVASRRDQLDRAILSVARFEANDTAAGHLAFTDAPGPESNAHGPLPKYGVLYGRDKAWLTKTTNVAQPPPLPDVEPDRPFDLSHEGVRMRGVIVAVPNGSGARILLTTTREELENDAELLGRAMLFAFLVGCGWAAAVAFGVATRLTRDHDTIADVARSVADGDVSARVTLRGSGTDLKRLGDDINAMIERLTGLLGAQDRFVTHAAHELRTPLAAMRLEIEHALRSSGDRATLEAAMRATLESLGRLASLADDLLALARARPDRGAIAGDASSVPLEDAIRGAVDLVAPLADARAVRIDAADSSVAVRAEARGLTRLLRNLVENAVRFAPEGSAVVVAQELDGSEVVVRISDDGPGVAAEEVERIFEPFARGLRRRDPEGTGLGLSIARELAESYGGSLTAVSGPGGRFVLRLRRG